MANEPLQIDQISFMVTSLIDRSPHWTMFRELTKNATEAAEKDGDDRKVVHWTTGDYEGTRKAVIWSSEKSGICPCWRFGGPLRRELPS